MTERERIDTVIIGAGQSGLSVGYHLARRRVPFVILEANQRIGDSWRQRWDSLRLFTPARYDGLVGLPFPAAGPSFPTKHEMADYLEAYARRFELPVQTGARVDRLSREDQHFVVDVGNRRIEARQVVIAMASYQVSRVPAFAGELRPDIVQLHSRDYRNPGQFRDGGLLIVGAGNSGAEIAMDTARAGIPTWMSGRDTGHIPFRVDSRIAYHTVVPVLFRVVFHRVLSVSTPMGRRVRQHMVTKGAPLIRVKPNELRAAGVTRVERTIGVRDGLPLLANDRTLDVKNVVWCTGFDPGFSWIDLPVFGPDGEPMQHRGVVAREPGLYFVGLHFLYSASSTMIHGIARDAQYVANAIVARARRAAA